MLYRKSGGFAEGRRTSVTAERNLDVRVAVDSKHTTEGVFAEPARMFGVDLAMASPAIDEAADIEHIRRGEHELATGFQMPTRTGEKSVDVVEVLDDLTCKHGVERPIEVEVLGVSQLHVEPFCPERCNRFFVYVDSNNLGKALDHQAMQPVGLSVARRTTDIEDGIATDERHDHFKAVLECSITPRMIPPFWLQEVSRGWSVRRDDPEPPARQTRIPAHHSRSILPAAALKPTTQKADHLPANATPDWATRPLTPYVLCPRAVIATPA